MHFLQILVIFGEWYFTNKITCFTILLLHFFIRCFFFLCSRFEGSRFYVLFFSLFYDSHREEYSFVIFLGTFILITVTIHTNNSFFTKFIFLPLNATFFFSEKIPDFSAVIFFFFYLALFNSSSLRTFCQLRTCVCSSLRRFRQLRLLF